MKVTPERVDEHARRWRVVRPEGFVHPRELLLTPEQTRIPTDRYLSDDVRRAEQEQLFLRTWQVAGRVENVAEPGDQLPYAIGDQEFVVVRQVDGGLRAFANVCLHRGNLLVREAGNAEALRCPYHGWCWKLDGSLADVPDAYLATGVDAGTHSLPEIGCDTWGGFVFVHPGGREVPPLAEHLAPILDALAPYRMDAQRLTSWTTTELACNWKVVAEAFLETYHVPGIHPRLVTLLDETNTGYQRLGRHHRMWIPYGLPSLRFAETDDREVYESYLREHFRPRHLDPEQLPEEADPASWEPSFGVGGAIDGERNAREYLRERQCVEGAIKGHDYGHLTQEQLIDIDHHFLFPNFVMLAKADDTFIIWPRPHARDPERCHADILHLTHPGSAPPWRAPRRREVDATEEAVKAAIGEVISQDFANVVGVQRGLRQRRLDHVTLTANDVRIRWFHDDVDAMLAGDAS